MPKGKGKGRRFQRRAYIAYDDDGRPYLDHEYDEDEENQEDGTWSQYENNPASYDGEEEEDEDDDQNSGGHEESEWDE